MKKLLPPANTVIPSNRPRTRAGPDSRGIRICFAELGRSCHLKQGYLIFTDGSAYVYDTPSNADVENLCSQLQRGKVFNLGTRRAEVGFVRGFTPPADYETIYTYPPYLGVTPAACPLVTDWNSLLWDGWLTNDPSIHTVTGTGLHVVGSYAGGILNSTFIQTNSIVIQADAPYVDITFKNHSATATLFAEIEDSGFHHFAIFAAQAPGGSETIRLTLDGGLTQFVGGIASQPPGALSYDCTFDLVPP